MEKINSSPKKTTDSNYDSDFTLDDYYELERHISSHINLHFSETLESQKLKYLTNINQNNQINKSKLSNLSNSLKFNDSLKSIYWIFNKKTIKSSNQGDLNSSNLYKLHYDLFPKTEFDEQNTK